MRILKTTLVVLLLLFAGLAAFDHFAPYEAARIGVNLERSRSGLAPKQVTVNGLDIAYLEGGQGDALVLVHGFGADKDNFTRVAGQLTPHYRVIIPDLPGFGESSKPADADYRIPAQVERLHALLQTLGVQRAHLGGSSMGGAIVTSYALMYPDASGSLWLLAPAGLSQAFDLGIGKQISETGRNGLLAEKPEDFPAIMDYVMSKPPFFPPSIKRVLGERAAADYALHARIFAQLGDPSQAHPWLDDLIRDVRTPALVVWGKEDRVLSAEAAAIYQTQMPGAQIIVMPGIGHLPMLEDPRQTAGDYLKFRAGLN